MASPAAANIDEAKPRAVIFGKGRVGSVGSAMIFLIGSLAPKTIKRTFQATD